VNHKLSEGHAEQEDDLQIGSQGRTEVSVGGAKVQTQREEKSL